MARVTTLWPGVRYRADASFGVAGVGVAVAFAELAVAQVQASSRAGISSCTILESKDHGLDGF